MHNTDLKGRRLLKVTSILYIILSALGLLAALGIIAVGLASGASGGEGLALGLTVSIIALGVFAIPSSLFSLVASILGLRWCGRPDKVRPLFALGLVLSAVAALNLLLSLFGDNPSALAGDLVRLVLSVLYAAGAWKNRQSLQ